MKPLFDQADLGLTKEQVAKAFWAAKLPTQFVRDNFFLTDDSHQDGTLRRFYLMTPAGAEAIEPFIEEVLNENHS